MFLPVCIKPTHEKRHSLWYFNFPLSTTTNMYFDALSVIKQ